MPEMKMVPIEPTEAMLHVGSDALMADNATVRDAYRAMLAASQPAPAREGVEDVVEIASKAYAEATGYYVQFHAGLSSPSADIIRTGIRAALAALTPREEAPAEGAVDEWRREVCDRLGLDSANNWTPLEVFRHVDENLRARTSEPEARGAVLDPSVYDEADQSLARREDAGRKRLEAKIAPELWTWLNERGLCPDVGADGTADWLEIVTCLNVHEVDLMVHAPASADKLRVAVDGVPEGLYVALTDAWTDFLDANPDDLTSPADLPDHALVTCDQMIDIVREALAALTEGGK